MLGNKNWLYSIQSRLPIYLSLFLLRPCALLEEQVVFQDSISAMSTADREAEIALYVMPEQPPPSSSSKFSGMTPLTHLLGLTPTTMLPSSRSS